MPLSHVTTPPSGLVPLLPAMTRLARRLTQTREAADDLVQDASLNIWAALSKGQAIHDMRPYAMATVRNLARSTARQARDLVEMTDETVQVSPDAPRHLACAETRRAIARLPKPQARLLTLVAEGEVSPAMLAQYTGCPVGTVMSRLARARVRLRRDMGLGPDMSVTELF
jgi:RNA polymerase sigma factor (sigma-70 family)